MSAFIVSDNHIKLLAVWDGVGEQLDLENVQRVADVLHAANVKSVNTRYKESTELPVPQIKLNDVSHFSRFDPVHVLKAIHCFGYQSCEHKSWEQSEAKEICDNIQYSAIRKLKGYDAAPWETK